MNKQRKRRFVSFTARRWRSALLSLAAMVLFSWWVNWQNQNLQRSAFLTGLILLGCLVFLTAFNLRKRISFLPQLGTAAFWMQLHIYVGLCTFVIFGWHIAWQFPSGWFEQILAALYLLVAGSGIYGLYLTRWLPRRLTALKDEVIFERIPALRHAIANRTRQLVLQARESSDVLAKFYVNKLAGFFERPRSFAYLVNPNGRRRRQLIAEIQDLDRYLAEDQRAVSRKLRQMVQQKDDLDYHFAVQGRLKVWLFVHIGMTYSLLLFAIVHGLMAYSFGGGLP